MATPDNNLGSVFQSPQAAGLLKNKDALKGLIASPDTQKLMAMLNQKAGDGLKSAADAAAKGDPSALVGLVNQLMGSREGADLVARINKSFQQQQQ